ncbi:unnamed protein product [Prunus armeniaca]
MGGVEGGEDLKPRLGYEGEWGRITYPRRAASTGLVVVAMSTTLATAEGMLVVILPFGVLGTWCGGKMLRWGWGGY